MSFDNTSRQGGGFERQMYNVTDMNIKCADCGAAITELPFKPDPARVDSLRCRDCMRKFRDANPRPRNRY